MPLLLESIIFIFFGIFPLVKLFICSLGDDSGDDYNQESVQASQGTPTVSKRSNRVCNKAARSSGWRKDYRRTDTVAKDDLEASLGSAASRKT